MAAKSVVVLMGDSVLIESLGESMRKELKFQIVQMFDGDVDLEKNLKTFKPEFIVIDLDSVRPATIVSLIRDYSGLSFFGIDHSTSQTIIFKSNQYPIHSMHEFCQLAQTGLNPDLQHLKGGLFTQETIYASNSK